MAGHGVNDRRNRYYFLASDTDVKQLRGSGLSKDVMHGLAGKSVVIMDTCHSVRVLECVRRRGRVDITAFVNELASAENGVVAYAPSTGREVSRSIRTGGTRD